MIKEYPRTVQEAVKRLLLELPDWDKLGIKNTSEKDLATLHMTLGNYIRNEFGLWRNNKELLRDCLPESSEQKADDASSVIIKALWKSLQPTA
jgi:hypothetical protein